MVVALLLSAGIVVSLFLGAALFGSSKAVESAPVFLGAALLPIAWSVWPVFTYSRMAAVGTGILWLVVGPSALAFVHGDLGEALRQSWIFVTALLAIWSGFHQPTVLQVIEANEKRRRVEKAIGDA